MLFIALTVSNSVDFDQTAHIQELSDLCLQPFVRPINPFGIFFDLWSQPYVFSPPKKSRGPGLEKSSVLPVLDRFLKLKTDLFLDKS